MLKLLEKDKRIFDRLVEPNIPLYEKNFPLILFWTRKSGCTTINKWFFFQIGLLEKVNKEKLGDPHGYREFIFRNEPYYTKGLHNYLLNSSKNTYKLVRNPYRRAVSSFFQTISSSWLINIFDSDLSKGLSFKQYLYHLKKLNSIETIDPHIAQQYVEGEECFIRKIIYLEKFTDEITRLEEKYNLKKSPITTITESPHHFSFGPFQKMFEKGDFSEKVLSLDHFYGKLPTFESFYDQETKELVGDIYNLDFKAYGYKTSDLV